LGCTRSGPNNAGSAAPGIAHASKHRASHRAACDLIASLACAIRSRATPMNAGGSGKMSAMFGSVQVSTVAPVSVSPSSSRPTSAVNRSGPKPGSRMSFTPTVTVTRSGARPATSGICRSTTAVTLAPSAARLVSVQGTAVRADKIPASRRAQPIRAPPGSASSRPAVRLSPSAT
jgi:hypothetical protein